MLFIFPRLLMSERAQSRVFGDLTCGRSVRFENLRDVPGLEVFTHSDLLYKSSSGTRCPLLFSLSYPFSLYFALSLFLFLSSRGSPVISTVLPHARRACFHPVFSYWLCCRSAVFGVPFMRSNRPVGKRFSLCVLITEIKLLAVKSQTRASLVPGHHSSLALHHFLSSDCACAPQLFTIFLNEQEIVQDRVAWNNICTAEHFFLSNVLQRFKLSRFSQS